MSQVEFDNKRNNRCRTKDTWWWWCDL